MSSMPSPPVTRSGKPIKERILLYGDSDSGKTYNFLKIAQWHQRRGSSATFFGICSPGNEWDVFLAPGGEFEDLENVVAIDVDHIGEYYDAYDKRIKPKAGPEDWLCVDVIGDAYNAAKDEYAQREWKGMDLGQKWGLEGGEYPITGWEWGPINARYNGLAQNRIMRFAGHVMVLAWDRELKDDSRSGRSGERDEIKQTFSMVGYRPDSQWDDYKRFKTIIHLSKNIRGDFVMRTARDKQRPIVGEVVEKGKANRIYKPAEVGDFMRTYLRAIAGWTL